MFVFLDNQGQECAWTGYVCFCVALLALGTTRVKDEPYSADALRGAINAEIWAETQCLAVPPAVLLASKHESAVCNDLMAALSLPGPLTYIGSRLFVRM